MVVVIVVVVVGGGIGQRETRTVGSAGKLYIYICIYYRVNEKERERASEKTASAVDYTTRLPNLVIGYTPSVCDAILGLTCTPNNRSLLCHGPRDPRGSSPRTVALLMMMLLPLQSFVVRSEWCFYDDSSARTYLQRISGIYIDMCFYIHTRNNIWIK